MNKLLISLYFFIGSLVSSACKPEKAGRPARSDKAPAETTGTDTGGWVGGGGELSSHHNNPWFIQNTPEIRYCIETNKTTFSASEEIFRQAIKVSFQLWQRNLDFEINAIKMATQTLTEVSCQDNPDMRFQGGVLTPEQAAFIKTPEQYVALLVRTEYDEDKLRGRGFIYVAPEKGDLAPEGITPNIWSMASGRNLMFVLLHEWGHVLGIQHHGDGPMAPQFPELVALNPQGIYGTYFDLKDLVLFNLKKVRHLSFCDDDLSQQVDFEFFGIPAGTKCLAADFTGGTSFFTLSAAPGADQSFVKVGEARPFSLNGGLDGHLIEIFFQPGNKVIKGEVEPRQRLIGYGGMASETAYSRYVIAASKVERNIFTSLTYSKFSLSKKKDNHAYEEDFAFYLPLY